MYPQHVRELLVNLFRETTEPTWTQRNALAAESCILTQHQVNVWFDYARNRFLRPDGIDENAILRYRISGLSVAETLDVIERERERQRHIANEEFAGKEDYLAFMEREIERQRDRVTEEYLEQQERDERQHMTNELLQREASIVWDWDESGREWSLEQRFYFLIGILESDGSVACGRVQLEMRSDYYLDVVRHFSNEVRGGLYPISRSLRRNFSGEWILMAEARESMIGPVREFFSYSCRFLSANKQAQINDFLHVQQHHLATEPLVPILKAARDAGEDLSDARRWPCPFHLPVHDPRNIPWLCGVLVGDGCFTTSGKSPVCSLRMCNEQVMEKVSTLVAANCRNIGPSSIGRLNQYEVVICANKLWRLKDHMLPFLFKRRGERLTELFSSWEPQINISFDLPILNISRNPNNE